MYANPLYDARSTTSIRFPSPPATKPPQAIPYVHPVRGNYPTTAMLPPTTPPHTPAKKSVLPKFLPENSVAAPQAAIFVPGTGPNVFAGIPNRSTVQRAAVMAVFPFHLIYNESTMS